MTVYKQGIMESILTVAETQVFSGVAPTSWTDLDLSGTIGAQASLVLLKVTETGNVDNGIVAVRKNGDTDEFYAATGFGTALGRFGQNSSVFAVVVCFTDTGGVIEWIVSAALTVTIDVMGYISG